MNTTKTTYGFTEDKVFGWVMEDKEFCRFVLQTILPQLDIREVQNLYLQRELSNADRQTKDVRLDILVRDQHNRVYNVEMQVADQDNLGQRMRYYLSKVDAHYTLEKSKSYNDLQATYIIFLCNFDYPGQGRIRYTYHEYEDQDKSLMLPTNSAKVIINAKGQLAGNSQDLQNLVKLMRGEPISGSKHFDYAQQKIKEINDDPKRRAQIMDYETKLLEREQLGEKQGRQQGITKMIGNTIKQLKAAGYDELDAYSFVKKLGAGLSDSTLRDMVDQYY
ncbi:Rpn family recombination-promoting nuclease/putative transposase [uncultured Limosilactobacillus sp.]|uniref:Rpn family recombination-promoting nuclease/putative transposase n=1 Tax=uncultured Limosilactobacillus sp. TaxID=2837629 RepID=UPI0025EAE682|nr:Rpn family recombination-promoting nuclease/putative transposase [uncultured Limosilactobacillus sp.]